jgi:succinate dehydrogenase/fumarate reductase flavoprotein subunit
MVERIEADVVVAGGGMGGLMAATYAHLAGARVVLLAGVPGASIRMAGFATALLDGPEDRPERLFNDMFIAGGFINNPKLLAAVVERIGRETRFLEQLGVPFHRQEDRPDGRLARRQAAGVSWPRAVFTLDMVGEDAGKRLTDRLRAAGAPPVWVLDRTFLLDLDRREGEICGALAYVRPEKRWVHIQAPAVVLATGGGGRLYSKTTNFAGSTGMGYALALEAGATLVDMEFVSFEPTVAVGPSSIAEMEVPTMAFSEGARLLNGRGEPFMTTMPPPSKDVMSRAMLREIVEGRGTPYGGVYYDLREMAPDTAMSYTQIRRVLKALNLPPNEARIEVAPTQHYVMGGVRTDENAGTDVPGLFAVGEVAGGAHGAHRLATCGGTEVIAMGAIAGQCAARYTRDRAVKLGDSQLQPATEFLEETMDAADTKRVGEIRTTLEQGCGVLRDRERLEHTVAALDAIREHLKDHGQMKTFAGRAALVASAIARSALLRTESRGDHFRNDHPRRDDRRWLGNLVTALGSDKATLDSTFHQAGIAARAKMSMP